MMNDENFQRSAIEPVGMVAAVSMNTIWKRNIATTPTSYVPPLRKNPLSPIRPKVFPNQRDRELVVELGAPPSVASAPTPPIMKAKPQIQNPSIPTT